MNLKGEVGALDSFDRWVIYSILKRRGVVAILNIVLNR